MSTVVDYARHSPYSDPGGFAGLLDPLPTDIRALTDVVRNVIAHYRDPQHPVTGDRMAEIDLRWLERALATDQQRFAGAPLAEPRPHAERVAGCCRDFTLLTVAALRHRGVPARSRVGFASYFAPDFHFDHDIVEYWDGERWIFVDAQVAAGPEWPPFDTCDLPIPVGADAPVPAHFSTAAQVWTAYRAGTIDPERYGADPGGPHRGAQFVQDEVLFELAHRQRDELLLWDLWGGILDTEGSCELVDEVAALLLAADDGDAAAEKELADRYARDARLHPGKRVLCQSPAGTATWVDLAARAPVDD